MQENIFLGILEDNLIDPAEFNAHPEKFQVMECFQFNLPKHPVFDKFGALRELRVVEQEVTDLSWLKDTPNLETLLVFHTDVCDCSGICHCENLVNLYLEANKIETVPDISKLKKLESFSISQNPITTNPEFPSLPSLKELNIASIGITYLSKSIHGLTGLERLNLGGNYFSDFDFIETLNGLENLTELALYDPRVGSNPVCELPNYDVVMCALLPKIQVLDMCKITDRYRAICVNRKREAEMYYRVCADAEVSALDLVRSNFMKEASAVVADVKRGAQVNEEEVNAVMQAFVTSKNEMEEFTRKCHELASMTGGNVAATRVSEDCEEFEDMVTLSSKRVILPGQTNLAAAWTVRVAAVAKELEGKSPERQGFIALPSLVDALKIIRKWNHHYEGRKDIEETVESNESTFSCLLCDVYPDNVSAPRAVLHFSDPAEALLSRIESACSAASHISVTPTNTPETLIAMKATFELANTLTSVTLVDCGITSLSIFSDLERVKELNVPYNDIKTLADLPHLPALTSLDVSFNKISYVEDLVPKERSAAVLITSLRIFGNPVYTPDVVKGLSSIYKQLVPDVKVSKASLVSLDTYFSGLDMQNITSLDLRCNSLTSLAPLSQLPKLEHLSVSQNGLRTIDFKSETLLYADFSLNSLTELPSPENFPNLTTLLANCNEIKTLVPFPSLIALFVAGNQIEALPSDKMFPNLCVLHISDNPLANSPTDLRILFQFPKMKMLNGIIITPQIHNRARSTFGGILFVEDLPKLISPNQSLLDLSEQEYRDVNVLKGHAIQTLALCNNNLTSISWEPKAMPRLLCLKLAGNQIQSFDFLRDLTTLRSLDLSANKLSDPHLRSLYGIHFPNLQVLILSNNSFKACEVLPRECFPQLESLDLSHNFIATVPPGAFDAVSTLRDLKLSYNSLRKLDNLGVASLASFDVSHNRVTSVDEVLKLGRCTQLVKFWFNDNPLAQRVSHRIRVLTILRNLKELDGRAVTESDLSQVRILLEQNSGLSMLPPAQSAAPVQPAGRKVNNVVLAPPLPSLQPTQPAKRGGRQGRYPR